MFVEVIVNELSWIQEQQYPHIVLSTHIARECIVSRERVTFEHNKRARESSIRAHIASITRQPIYGIAINYYVSFELLIVNVLNQLFALKLK